MVKSACEHNDANMLVHMFYSTCWFQHVEFHTTVPGYFSYFNLYFQPVPLWDSTLVYLFTYSISIYNIYLIKKQISKSYERAWAHPR